MEELNKKYTLQREQEHKQDQARRVFLNLQKVTGGGKEVRPLEVPAPPLGGFTNPKYTLLPMNSAGNLQPNLSFPVESAARANSAVLHGPSKAPQPGLTVPNQTIFDLSKYRYSEAISPPFTISFDDEMSGDIEAPGSSTAALGVSVAVVPGPRSSHAVLGQRSSSVVPGPNINVVPGPETHVVPGPNTPVLPGPTIPVVSGFCTPSDINQGQSGAASRAPRPSPKSTPSASPESSRKKKSLSGNPVSSAGLEVLAKQGKILGI